MPGHLPPYVPNTAISGEIDVPTFWRDRSPHRSAETRGRALYTRLLRRLTEPGYRQAIAGITQQVHPSIHRVVRGRALRARPARMSGCPPPQVTCGPLKIRKDVRPSQPGRAKVKLWTPLSSKNTL